EEAADELLLGRAERLRDLARPAQRQEVRERAVAELRCEAEHLPAQRGDDDRDRGLGHRVELEAARPALTGEHRAQRLDRRPHPAERLLERAPGPPPAATLGR